MNKHSFRFLVAIFVVISALLSFQLALAHGDEPRLEVSADSLNPGDYLEIRGVDFEFEEEITVVLATLELELPLGKVIGDTEGIFQLGVTLPADLPVGTYTVRATTDDHVVESSPITVWGTADLGGGEQGPWEEGDGLLAPMPTAAPAIATSPAQVVVEQAEPAPAQAENPSLPWAIAVVGVILIVAVIRVLRR